MRTPLWLSLKAMDNGEHEFAIDKIAGICHDANRGLCQAFGDNSHQPWALAPEWQRESMRAGVRRVLDNPDVTPQSLHEAWMADKLADGWVFGAVKDAEAKTHPCLVPYEKLPPEQLAKDRIFRSIVINLSCNLDVEVDAVEP